MREPGCVPVRKGPFHSTQQVKDFLIEVFDCSSNALTAVINVYADGGIDIEDGPQWLEIADGRQRHRASRNRASTRTAFAAHAKRSR